MGQEGSLRLLPWHHHRPSPLRPARPPVCPRRRGTMIARVEWDGATRTSEGVLKAARALVLFARVAALASLAFAAAPGSAATPAKLQILIVSDVRFAAPLSITGRVVTEAEAETLPYSLGKTTALARIKSRGALPAPWRRLGNSSQFRMVAGHPELDRPGRQDDAQF